METHDEKVLDAFDFKGSLKEWSFALFPKLKCSAAVWIDKQLLCFCLGLCSEYLYWICWVVISNLPVSKELVIDWAELPGFSSEEGLSRSDCSWASDTASW